MNASSAALRYIPLTFAYEDVPDSNEHYVVGSEVDDTSHLAPPCMVPRSEDAFPT